MADIFVDNLYRIAYKLALQFAQILSSICALCVQILYLPCLSTINHSQT